MKIKNLFEKNDYQFDTERSRKWMDQKELQKIFDIVQPNMMDKSDVDSAAHDLAGSSEFLRTVGAAKMSIARMHTLVHGQLPDGMDVDNTWLAKISGNIVKFVSSQGYDVEKHLQSARVDMEERMARKSRQRSKDEALKAMSAFYKEHRRNLGANVADYRDEIVQKLMNGETPEEAFAKFVK